MTNDELDAIVEAKLADQLAARLQADRDRVRTEVILAIRREADREWYNRVNAKHPIEGALAGLTPEQHRARLAAMDAAVRADMESMNRSNSRLIEGSLLDQQSRAGQGFRIK
jgi:hypothetical protein